MSGPTPRECAAIDAVARHVSALCEKRDGEPHAYIALGGRRIALEVASLGRPYADNLAKPGLRFDRVALRVIARLQAALPGSVPDGLAVILTITAPIRLPAKTVMVLEDKVRDCLATQPRQTEHKDSIHGNLVRFRIVESRSGQTSKVIGLVHNPGTDPDALLDLMQSFLSCVASAAERPALPAATERWLAVVIGGSASYIGMYRQICGQFLQDSGFSEILLVFNGARVEKLAP